MMRRLRQFARDEHGAAVIELALFTPIFAVMVAGVVDLSNAYSRKLALEQGAQRAIEKIMQTTANTTVEGTLADEAVCQVNGTNADGTCKTTPISTSNVTVTFSQECTATAGSVTKQSTSNASTFDAYVCPNKTDAEARYIQVAVTDQYSPMFPIHFSNYNTTDGTYHLSATAGMRVK